MRALLGIASAAVLALGCGKQLNPDYCLAHPSDQDCQGAGLVVFDAPPPCGSSCTDPDRKVCVMGQCVACATAMDCTDPTRPVCVNNACVGCSSDSDCTGATVCVAGQCIPQGDVAFVAPGGSGTACSQAVPCTLEYALAQTTSSQIQLEMAPGSYTLGTATTIARSVDISAPAPVGEGPGMKHLDETMMAKIALGPGLTITSGTVRFAYVALSGSTGDGVTCQAGATLVLTDDFVSSNARNGIVSAGCTLDIERTRLHANAAAAITAQDATVSVVNDFIYKNGNGALANGVVLFTGATTGQLRFDTVAYNTFKGGVTPVDCRTTAVRINATDNLVVQNSGNNKPPGASSCDFTRSYFGADTAVHFATPGVDLHLTMMTPAGNPPAGIRDVSATNCSDIPVDIDGDVRPTNTFCDLGGDEYVPPPP